MKGLTHRQKLVLDFITKSMEDRGYPPTIREIGEKLGIRSTNGVNDHLKALERKGFLNRDKSKSRAIRLVDDEHTNLAIHGRQKYPDLLSLPFIGRIAAGEPILAEQNREATYHVDSSLLGPRRSDNRLFVLKVHGESMIDDGIFDGDLIFVEETTGARQGEIVAVMIDGEATVKRFYREDDRIILKPSNTSMEPIIVAESDGREASIIGRVIGVFRQV